MIDFSKTKFSLVNMKTGEELLNFNPITHNFHMDDFSVNQYPSGGITLNCEDVDSKLFDILYDKESSMQYNLEANGYRLVSIQARRHRSKRINKKWLKKYGYKEVKIPVNIKMDSCSITYNNDNMISSCEIEGKIKEIKYT